MMRIVLLLMTTIVLVVSISKCVADETHIQENSLHILKVESFKNEGVTITIDGLRIPSELQERCISRLVAEAKEGDLIVIDIQAATPQVLTEQLNDARKVCHDKHIALRFNKDPQAVKQVFWWSSPYELPRHHDATVYYWNQIRLGTGDQGFEEALAVLKTLSNGDRIHYSIAEYIPAGYRNQEIPYRPRQEEMTKLLESRNLQLQRLSPSRTKTLPHERAEH